jgi:hypothetical protein
MQMRGYVVRETDAAVAFVRACDAGIEGVRPLWLPRKKIEAMREIDELGLRIKTAQDGERQGTPWEVRVNADFAQKLNLQ